MTSKHRSAKIKEQAKAGVFPVRLGTQDWTSGDRLWLLDVIAPDRKLATTALLHFGQIAGERPVQLHPLVAANVDAEVLAKLRQA